MAFENKCEFCSGTGKCNYCKGKGEDHRGTPCKYCDPINPGSCKQCSGTGRMVD
ncbi:MAG: hypothetical protein U0166_24710 [Acidobacteriota bacterium]